MTDNKHPFWLGEDHPKWCQSSHGDPAVDIMDRQCWGDVAELPLSFMPGDGGPSEHNPEGLMTNLIREWRESEAHVNVGWIQGSMEPWNMTLDEAERFAFTLMRLVAVARDQDVPAGDTSEGQES